MSLPMEDIRILDLSRTLPGPYCTWLLADMGAEVIRVEQPDEIAKQEKIFAKKRIDSARREMRAYEALGRNKKSILLNLKNKAAQEIIRKLAQQSDVFVEDYRPGVMNRLGLDYESIKKINPGIVYCSISTFGQGGPYRDLAGHDPIALSLAGVLSQIADKNQTPVLPGVPIGDIATGLHAAIAILLALRVRDKEGQGQYLDISMVDCAMGFLIMNYQRYLGDGFIPKKGWQSPHIGVWQTKDGKYICTTNMEPQYWVNFCSAIGRDDFIPYQHDLTKREEMIEAIKELFLTKNRDEWFAILKKADTQVAPVYEINEVVSDPQVLYRQMVLEIEHPTLGKVKQLGLPIKLSETPGQIRHLAPLPGENTQDIMRRLGYSKKQIEKLVKEGVIKLDFEGARKIS